MSLLNIIKPLADKWITPEHLEKAFVTVSEPYQTDGQKIVMVVSRKGDGQVYGSIVGLNQDNLIVAQYAQKPLEEVLKSALDLL